MKLIASFLGYWIASAYTGSDFFEVDEYDAKDACYGEFVDGNKAAWASCCDTNANSFDSDNCKEKYYPFDVCYAVMTPGFVSVSSLEYGGYPTQEWTDCCYANCDELSCDSAYCYNFWDYIEEGLETWAIVLISVFSGLAFLAILFLICFCCCIKPKKKAKQAAAIAAAEQQRAQQQRAAAANVPVNHTPEHVYIVDHQAQLAAHQIPSGLPAGQYINPDPVYQNQQQNPQIHHHVVQHHVEGHGGPPLHQDGNAYVHAPGYDNLSNNPY